MAAVNRLLICDEHPLFRHGIRMMVLEEFPDAHIQECGAGGQALEEVLSKDWDIMIFEFKLSDCHGLHMLETIKARKPSLPILVLSCYTESLYAHRVMKSGAAGYLCKTCSKTDFISAVNKVVNRGKYVSPILAEQLAFRVRSTNLSALHDELSNRELEILSLLGQGEGVTAIAQRFQLGVNTVSSYRARILKKLHLKTTADLIQYAIRHLE